MQFLEKKLIKVEKSLNLKRDTQMNKKMKMTETKIKRPWKTPVVQEEDYKKTTQTIAGPPPPPSRPNKS